MARNPYEVRVRDPLAEDDDFYTACGDWMRGDVPDLNEAGFGIQLHMLKDLEDDGTVSRLMLGTDDLLRPAPLPLSPSSPPPEGAGEPPAARDLDGWVVLSTKPQQVGEWLVSCHPLPYVADTLPTVDEQTRYNNAAWRFLQTSLKQFKEKHSLLGFVFSKPLQWVLDQGDELFGVSMCGDCKSWDRAEGIAEYNRITHRFEGGDIGQLNKDVSRIVSAERDLANIDEEKLGFCTKFDRLIQCDFLGCDSFERRL